MLGKYSNVKVGPSSDIDCLHYVRILYSQYVFDPIIRIYDNNNNVAFTVDNFPPEARERFTYEQLSCINCNGGYKFRLAECCMPQSYTIKCFILRIDGLLFYCTALVYYRPFKVLEDKTGIDQNKPKNSGGWFSSDIVVTPHLVLETQKAQISRRKHQPSDLRESGVYP